MDRQDGQTATTGAPVPATFDPLAPGAMTAEELVARLTAPEPPPGGVHRLAGKRVSGQVDLRHRRVGFPVELEDCVFELAPWLDGADLVALHLRGGQAPGLRARQLSLACDLWLGPGFRSDGAVDLAGARIGGGLSLEGAVLVGDGSVALDCARASIGECLTLDAGTTLSGGALRLSNAVIDADLVCLACLDHPTGRCVEANLLTVKGDARFEGAHDCAGAIDLTSAGVGGRLHIGGDRVVHGGKDGAVVCPGISVGQNVDVDEHIVIEGALCMPFAKVGAQVVLSEVTIRGGGDRAVNGEGAVIKGDVNIDAPTTVEGTISFIGAQVSGDFECHAHVIGHDGKALWMQRSSINGTVYLDGLRTSGEVSMLGTHVGLDLRLVGATLQNPGGWALRACRASIDKDAMLNGGFTCTGNLDFIRAEIKGSLLLDDATVQCPGGTALDMRGARVTGVLKTTMRTAPVGLVNLLDAQVGVLTDNEQTWPAQVVLEGFTYGVLDPTSPADVRSRLRWLSRNRDGYSSRLYEPLINVLRTAGKDDDARQVEFAREKERARHMPWQVRWVYGFLGITVGYGYATRRIIWWILGLLAVGTVAFWALYTYAHGIAVKDPKAPQTFNPFFYTLDLLIPVVGLGIRGFWLTSGAALYLTWIFMIAGWLLAAVIVAGLSQMVRKN